MKFDTYQDWTMDTAVYPGAEKVFGIHSNNIRRLGLDYAILGLLGEAGELANKAKKVIRDDQGILDMRSRDGIISELGDVLWYAARVAEHLGMYLSDVALLNQEKLEGRKDRGVLKGSGDDR